MITAERSGGYAESASLIIGQARRMYGDLLRVVFTNGCFDLLHPGHINLLRYCKDQAGPHGIVVVGLNDDDSVRRLKGEGRPIMDARARALMLLATRFVDQVVTFEEDTPLNLIEALRPDIIVKGGDYKISEVVGRTVSTVLLAPYDDTWSTSKIIERLK